MIIESAANVQIRAIEVVEVIDVITMVIEVSRCTLLVEGSAFVVFTESRRYRFLEGRLSLGSVTSGAVATRCTSFDVASLLCRSNVLVRDFDDVYGRDDLGVDEGDAFDSYCEDDGFFRVASGFTAFVVRVEGRGDDVLGEIYGFGQDDGRS